MGLAAVVMARAMQALTAGRRRRWRCCAGLLAAVAGRRWCPALINGTLISRLRVPPFIGTLGMYGVARGAGFLAASGTTVPVNNPLLFADSATAGSWACPLPVVITVVLVAGDALGPVADPLRPAHLRHRRQPHRPRSAPASTSAATRSCST